MKMVVKEKAEKLYKSVGTFILSCIGEDGYPLTKAVVPAVIRDSIEEIISAQMPPQILQRQYLKTIKPAFIFTAKNYFGRVVI